VREEGAQQVGFSLQGASVATSGVCESRQVEMRRVGQGIRFQVAPGIFDRVQVRCVGGQEIRLGISAGGQELRGSASAMGIQPIPEQQPRSVQFAVQVAQEGDHLLGVDVGIGMEAEIKPAFAAAQTQDGDDGDLLMMHAALQQQWCLPPRRTNGAIRKPLSSRNTSQAFRRRVFF
jgi:hypothetical protein